MEFSAINSDTGSEDGEYASDDDGFDFESNEDASNVATDQIFEPISDVGSVVSDILDSEEDETPLSQRMNE